jgi:RimJ/RimL family protein N-acetyltransferase
MQPKAPCCIPNLATARLVLRSLRYDDVSDIFAYARDPEVARHTLWEPHRSERDSEAFFDFVAHQQGTDRMFVWGITLKPNDHIIGTIGLANYVPAHARAELGFAIGRQYWNQGLTTEAVAAVLKFGFDELELNRIEAYCKVVNLASARVLEKSGMSLEGVLRQRDRIKGKFEDLSLYAILKQDY